ncbi:beta-ketoacyl synthase N-terminal-like domain-containing protein [Kitasatospora sp. NPDC051853]|uniref:beta-ketoacyl synthase N-terminal-like domain-containing protein n=1 Tax=Kitasatospora sp. NPDC051853 TaxID=3364058 RepID=UPI00379F2C6C
MNRPTRALRTLAGANWPPPDGERDLPPLPGFTASTFNPLVAAVAELCLTRHRDATLGTAVGGPDSTPAGRTGLLLASAGGDRATALAIDTAAASGRRMPPLLFFQSNPNAVLGHVAARWELTGPVVAISPREAAAPGEVPPDALELAALMLADGDADQVLVIAAEQAVRDGEGDHGTAVLVTSA